MKKIMCGVIFLAVLTSCSGPSYFNSPTDFVGGNRSAAVETHCARQAGEGKDRLIYKLCEQSFNTHYGK